MWAASRSPSGVSCVSARGHRPRLVCLCRSPQGVRQPGQYGNNRSRTVSSGDTETRRRAALLPNRSALVRSGSTGKHGTGFARPTITLTAGYPEYSSRSSRNRFSSTGTSSLPPHASMRCQLVSIAARVAGCPSLNAAESDGCHAQPAAAPPAGLVPADVPCLIQLGRPIPGARRSGPGRGRLPATTRAGSRPGPPVRLAVSARHR